ncbi:MAG: hypothetical protein ACPLSA_05915, partial [Caldanaerobacter sp.]
FPALFVEGEGALVEAHAGRFELLEFGEFPLFLGSFCYASDGTDNEVGLEPVLFLDGAVAKVREFDFVVGAVFLGNAEDVIAGVSKPLQRFKEDSSLFGIDLELAFDCLYELHGCILRHIRGKSNRAFFPRLKSRGLPRGKDGDFCNLSIHLALTSSSLVIFLSKERREDKFTSSGILFYLQFKFIIILPSFYLIF